MTNKVIWITGASSGIGKALAIKFSNEGWQVAASARRENLLKELNKKHPNIFENIETKETIFFSFLSEKITNKVEHHKNTQKQYKKQ